MSRKIILYGAYDRYNYGDNLMPILIKRFFEINNQQNTHDFEFIYASINSSDLSKYECFPTVAMKDLISIEGEVAIIIVGGEILGADAGTLYTHVQTSHLFTRFLKTLRRCYPDALTMLAKKFYPAVWDYPYIPRKSSFSNANNIKIIFNTVGGIAVDEQVKFVSDADYISSRDQRTYDNILPYADSELIPDSVLIASRIVNNQLFNKFVRQDIISYCHHARYITVQACPYKISFTAEELAFELDKIKRETNLDVILLPIGYASGHDDVFFLRDVQKFSKTGIDLQYELNVWEIMYFLAHSQSFYGTSLHGIITAMSFGIPHFCIDARIKKITSFVETWSVEPFISPIEIGEIKECAVRMNTYDNANLCDAVSAAQELISKSLMKWISML